MDTVQVNTEEIRHLESNAFGIWNHLVYHSFSIENIIVAGSPVAGVVWITGTTGVVAMNLSKCLIFSPWKNADFSKGADS